MRIGFVVPWYGENIPGGAEAEAKSIAEHLSKEGYDVEVLTTCVKDFYSDWNVNYYAEGASETNGLQIRRFEVRKRNALLFDHINSKLMNGHSVTPKEEISFIEEMVNSPHLYEYLKNNADNYDFLVFTPYMFGTTYYGSLIRPEKTILIPCLHDESYAHMKIYQDVFNKARGIIFYAYAEERFAKKVFPLDNVKLEIIGGGIDIEFESNPVRFREKYNLNSPFIMYAGRKEQGKNTQLLVDHFIRYKKNNDNDLHLVLIGPGRVDIPKDYNWCIHDLGFVSKQDKYDAYAAATMFCNPSAFESFSIVLMESWLCNVPVIVNDACDVTKEHCIKSNAGLYFNDFDQFEGCVNFYLNHEELRVKMGENGRKYVISNYSWKIIIEKYRQFFNTLGG
jgi:glycosyltransferase involved in cell wall biosynthesis